jgi:hypothetical protein
VDSGRYATGAFGMPAAVNLVSFFGYMTEHGVTNARIWGIASAYGLTDGTPDTTLTVFGPNRTVMSPAAEAFRLMSGSLQGMTMLDIGRDLRLVDNRHDDHILTVWKDASKIVMFVGVGDIGGKDFRLALDVSDFGRLTNPQAKLVVTENGGIIGYADTVRQDVAILNGIVNITFDQDFGVARLVLDGVPLNNMNRIDASASGSFSGTAKDDLITSGAARNVLAGWKGDDILRDKGGQNILYGGTGDDLLQGGADNDRLIGGAGNDEVRDERGRTVAMGGAGDDAISLQGGRAVVTGGTGSDLIRTGLGNDVIKGGVGRDVIDADHEPGSRTGEDRIAGGKGNDMLQGGRGADTFVFRPRQGDDVIAAFDTDAARYNDDKGYSISLDGRDFQPGIDSVELIGLAGINRHNVMQFVERTSDGALFSAEDTSILFHDLARADLSASDFIPA